MQFQLKLVRSSPSWLLSNPRLVRARFASLETDFRPVLSVPLHRFVIGQRTVVREQTQQLPHFTCSQRGQGQTL